MFKNKLDKLVFVFSLLSALLLLSCKENDSTGPQIAKDRITRWQEDIDYFRKQFKQLHINFSGLINESKFDDELNYVKSNVDKLQDYEIFFRIQRLVASMHVAHTYVSPPVSLQFHALPIVTYFFKDGLFIIGTDDANKNIIGKKITKIGGKEIGVVIDSLGKIISYENSYWMKSLIPQTLLTSEPLKYFGIIDSLGKVDLEVEGTGKVSLQTTNGSYLYGASGLKGLLDGKALPLYMQNGSSYYWYTYLQDAKILYLKYNSCANMTDKSFAVLVEEIKTFMSTNKVDKFVVDVRNNMGGNSQVIEPLSSLTTTDLNQKGRLFVVIGRQTISSALMNAISFKLYSNCLIVGEPTGGKPNSYGEVSSFSLPNSLFRVQYSSKYFTLLQDDPDALYPDFTVDILFADYAAAHDPVLDFIINYK